MDRHAPRRAALLAIGIALAGCSPGPHRATVGTPTITGSVVADPAPGAPAGSGSGSTTTLAGGAAPVSPGSGSTPTGGSATPAANQSPGGTTASPGGTTPAAPTSPGGASGPTGTTAPSGATTATTGAAPSDLTATPEQCALLRQALAIVNDAKLHDLAVQAGCI